MCRIKALVKCRMTEKSVGKEGRKDADARVPKHLRGITSEHQLQVHLTVGKSRQQIDGGGWHYGLGWVRLG